MPGMQSRRRFNPEDQGGVNLPMKSIPKRRYSTGNLKLEQKIAELIEAGGVFSDQDLITEMIVTALKIGAEGIDRGDLKLINAATKEIRYAFKVFYPYRHIRKVALFGSARTPRDSANYRLARDFAREITKAGWMVVTGASSGIMSAGNEGAGRAKSFGVNIRLPFEQEPNPTIANDPKLINFKYFFTRKLIFIRESDATVLFPGGFGTHDEGFETLTLIQTGKTSPRPIVCLDPPQSNYWKTWKEFLQKHLVRSRMIDKEDIELIHFCHDAAEAAKIVTHFYHNYHSSRYIRDRLILRLKRPFEAGALRQLNREFKGLLAKGKIEQYFKPFPEEENEPHTFGFVRLAFYFNRRHFSKLQHLIQCMNEAD